MIKEMLNKLNEYFTQSFIADILGVSDRMIRYYKQGKSKPKGDKVEKIQKLYKLIDKLEKAGRKKKVKHENELKALKLLTDWRENCTGYKFYKETKDGFIKNNVDDSQFNNCEDFENYIRDLVISELQDLQAERTDLFLGAVDFLNWTRRQHDTIEQVKEYIREFVGSGLFYDVYLTEWGTYAIEFYS